MAFISCAPRMNNERFVTLEQFDPSKMLRKLFVLTRSAILSAARFVYDVVRESKKPYSVGVRGVATYERQYTVMSIRDGPKKNLVTFFKSNVCWQQRVGESGKVQGEGGLLLLPPHPPTALPRQCYEHTSV